MSLDAPRASIVVALITTLGSLIVAGITLYSNQQKTNELRQQTSQLDQSQSVITDLRKEISNLKTEVNSLQVEISRKGDTGEIKPPLPPPSSASSTAHGFLFELLQCAKTERTVTCSFNVTNTGEDRILGIAFGYGYASSLFDQESRQTPVRSIAIAGGGSDAGGRIVQMLISGKRAPVQLVFQEVASNALEASKLDLNCWDGERRQEFHVNFKNVHLHQN